MATWPRHLDYGAEEHPLALQLGGNEPAELAHCARLAAAWGYDEINLNCGCPSDRVQRGAFGACLMAEPQRVADGVKAMRDACTLPVTVKHRIGIDRIERYDFVRDFVGTVAEAGCEVFIVHARNAWLDGLSPKDNREIPPLRYDIVHRLKRDFPALSIVINGGIAGDAAIARAAAAGRRRDGRPRGLPPPLVDGRAGTPTSWAMPREPAAARAGRGRDAALHGGPAGAGPAVDACGAPHAGPVERHAGRAQVAPGVVESPPEGPAAGPGGAAGRRGALPRDPCTPSRWTPEAPRLAIRYRSIDE